MEDLQQRRTSTQVTSTQRESVDEPSMAARARDSIAKGHAPSADRTLICACLFAMLLTRNARGTSVCISALRPLLPLRVPLVLPAAACRCPLLPPFFFLFLIFLTVGALVELRLGVSAER